MSKFLRNFIIAYFAINVQIYSQESIPVEPIWSTAYGSKEHTSRDDLYDIKFDSDSNLIVLGSVERDSSFNDIVVQKITREGKTLWNNHYSSGIGMDYDFPIEMKIDSENNIIVLGCYATENSWEVGLILYKIDSVGNLLWERDISSFTGQFSDLNYTKICLLRNNGVRLVSVVNRNSSINYKIFEFSKDGELINNKDVNEITGSIFALSTNNKGSFFTFCSKMEETVNKYWIREISDSIQIDYELSLTSEQEDIMNRRSWEVIKADLVGNLYIIDNYSTRQDTSYHVIKISTTGKVFNYGVTNLDNFMAIENFCFKEGSLVLVGRQIDETKINYTFLLELDNNLAFMNFRKINALPNYVPRNIASENDSVYIVLDNQIDGTSSVFSINHSLELVWDYSIDFPRDYQFYYTAFIKLNNQCIIGGTIEKPKFEGSDYLSEREFFIECFNNNTQHKLWEYIYNDIGTSYTLVKYLFQDHKKNTFIFKSEALGSSHMVLYAPEKYYVLKFDTLGNKLWELPLDYYFDDYYTGIEFDESNNLYLIGMRASKVYLIRILEDGSEINETMLDDYVRDFYIDKKNNIYIDATNDDSNLQEYDSNLSHINDIEIKGDILQLFQLENSDTIYYYTLKDIDYDKTEISLYINHKLKWSKPVDMSSPYNGYINSDYNKKTGCLYFMSAWGQVNKYIQRLTLDGHYSYTAFKNGPEDLGNISSLSNENLLVEMEDHWELFSEDLSKKSILRVSRLAGDESSIVGDYIFEINNGNAIIYDYNLNEIGKVTNEKINNCIRGYLVDEGFDLYTSNSFGHALPIIWGYYMFGYRCAIGDISRFKLSDKIDFTISESSDPQFLIDNIVCDFSEDTVPQDSINTNVLSEVYSQKIWHYVNNDEIVIVRSVSNLDLPMCKIQLFNMNGVLITSKNWLDQINKTEISMNNLPKGVYLIRLIDSSNGKVLYHSKVIH